MYSGGRGFDSHRGQKIFSLPRVVPCFPLLGLTPSGLFMGLSSTIIYTSELILCSTICVPSATRHNIHMYPYYSASPPNGRPVITATYFCPCKTLSFVITGTTSKFLSGGGQLKKNAWTKVYFLWGGGCSGIFISFIYSDGECFDNDKTFFSHLQ